MRTITFTGGAGCGKTYQLMKAMISHLSAKPLNDWQKVLALTFMHGSRRRLQSRLESIPNVARRNDCTTIDSFAWRIVRRWRSLVSDLGFPALDPKKHDLVVKAAAATLQHEEVCKWVATTYPILIVDEAQDLSLDRVQILSALATKLKVLAAADEFQCLDPELRPNPALEWLESAGEIKTLREPKRTSISELLNAASALREGKPPVSDHLFKIQLASNPALAGTWLTNAITWFGGGKTVAVISPSYKGYANRVVDWTSSNKTKKGAGPINLKWEKAEGAEIGDLLEKMDIPNELEYSELINLLSQKASHRVTKDVTSWADKQRRALGRITYSKDEVTDSITQSFSNQKRLNSAEDKHRCALTVHGAKNREFDNVIVLWSASVVGSDDQKRRLLYNAVTRARERCLVLVQTSSALKNVPFA